MHIVKVNLSPEPAYDSVYFEGLEQDFSNAIA